MKMNKKIVSLICWLTLFAAVWLGVSVVGSAGQLTGSEEETGQVQAVMISVTSGLITDGRENTTVVYLNGGGQKTVGSVCTLNAEDVKGFEYVGWYDETTGQLLTSDHAYSFTVEKGLSLIAKYKVLEGEKTLLTVKGNNYSISGGEGAAEGEFRRTDKVTVSFVGEAGEKFLYWQDENGKILSRNESYTFTLMEDIQLEAVTTKSTDARSLVIFKNEFDQVYAAKAYGAGEKIEFPADQPRKNMAFTGWSMTEAEIQERITAGDTEIYVLPVFEPVSGLNVNMYFIVEGEEIFDRTVELGTGESIHLGAPADYNGTPFSYWQDRYGNILSYIRSYSVFLETEDVFVYAVYGKEVPDAVEMRLSGEVVEDRIILKSNRMLSANYVIDSHGIVLGTDKVFGDDTPENREFAEEALNLEDSRVVVSRSTNFINQGEYMLNVNPKFQKRTVYAKAFVNYKEAGSDEIRTAYSDMVVIGYTPKDFEDYVEELKSVANAEFKEIPGQTIDVLGENVDLEIGYEYTLNDPNAAKTPYADYVMDFMVSFDKDINDGDVTLYGNYEPYGWVPVNMGAVSAEAEIKLLEAVSEQLSLGNFKVTYRYLAEAVKDFVCSATYKGNEVITLTLKLVANDGTRDIVVDTYNYTFYPTFTDYVENLKQEASLEITELPKQTVNVDGEDKEIAAGREYKLEDPNAAETPYAKYDTNFAVSVNRAINDGELMLYGNYGTYGWVEMPMAAMNAGDEVKLLPEGTVNYEELATLVQNFKCGADYSGGEELTVTVRLIANDGNADIVVDSFSYTFSTFTGYLGELDGENYVEIKDVTGDVTDENGNPVLDEDGDPISKSNVSAALKKETVGSSWTLDHALTNEEIANYRGLAVDEKGFHIVNGREYHLKDDAAGESKYADWLVDYEISFDQDVKAGEVILFGNYGEFGWTPIVLPFDMEAGEKALLLASSAEVFGTPWEMTYETLATDVNTFMCGAIYNGDKEMTVTVDLVGFERIDGVKTGLTEIVDEYSYTFNLDGTYSVQYLSEDGEHILYSETYAAGQTITPYTPSARAGQSFAGWFSASGEALPETMPGKHLFVYEKWIASLNTYLEELSGENYVEIKDVDGNEVDGNGAPVLDEAGDPVAKDNVTAGLKQETPGSFWTMDHPLTNEEIAEYKGIDVDDKGFHLVNGREYLLQDENAAESAYADWVIDFVVSFDKDVKAGDVILFGSFGEFGWTPIVLPYDMEAGEEARLLASAAEVFGTPWEMTYETLATDVKRFMCGAAYKGKDQMTVSVKLVGYERVDGALTGQEEIVDEVSYTFNLSNTFSVQYLSEDGEHILKTEVYSAGDAISAYVPEKRDGYKFVGWFTAADEALPTVMPAHHVFVYEKWEEGTPMPEFTTKFVNKDVYTYRVGNENNVTMGTVFTTGVPAAKAKALFAPAAEIPVESELVSVEITNKTGNASGTFTANTGDWTQGVLKFEGTGLVMVTLKYDDETAYELELEVVDATNVTAAANATDRNIVLLQNVGLGNSSINISGGHYLYGNGFKITCTGNGVRLSANGMAEGFINLSTGGTLDNVQVICPVFPKAYLYANSGTEYVTESGNLDTSISVSGKNYYKYQWSAVAVKNMATISNCFIYGARNNIYVSGSANIENTVCECGSLSNIFLAGTMTNTVTLDNVTTSQYPVTDSFGEGKTVMGLGIVSGSGDKDLMPTESNATIVVKNGLHQYNWLSENEFSQVNHTTVGKQMMNLGMSQTELYHEKDGVNYVNAGILYFNSLSNTTVPAIDNYVRKTVTYLGQTANVYSIGNRAGTVETANFKTSYTPTEQCLAAATISHEVIDFIATYEVSDGIYKYSYTVPELSAGESFSFDLGKLSVLRSGEAVTYAVKDSEGNAVNGTISLSKAGTYKFIVVPENDNKNYQLEFVVTQKSAAAPVITKAPNLDIVLMGTNDNNTFAVDMFTGMEITYFSNKEGKEVTKLVSDMLPAMTPGKLGDTDTFTIEVPDEFRITVVSNCGFHTTANSGKGTPYLVSGKYYFAGITTKYLSNSSITSGRSAGLSYTIEDFVGHNKVNGDATQKSYPKTFNSITGVTRYNQADFEKGTLKEQSTGGGSCVLPGTLITMADGSRKPVEDVVAGDLVLTWDLNEGDYSVKPIVFNDVEEAAECTVIYVTFSDDTVIGIVSEHGFFDKTLGEYVYLDEQAERYIGHAFVKEDGSVVTLCEVELRKEVTACCSPTTYGDLCYYTNGMLSMPGGISGLFNLFLVDTEGMKYDREKMLADIEKYGLLTLEDFGGMITEDMFEAFNGKYLGIAVAKGALTWEDIEYLANRYAPLCK